MKKTIFVVMIICTILLGVGCSKQSSAKNFGGTYTLELPQGKKLVNVTWKDDDLWYLVRDMKEDESAENYEFNEDSKFGIIEGTVIIKEFK